MQHGGKRACIKHVYVKHKDMVFMWHKPAGVVTNTDYNSLMPCTGKNSNNRTHVQIPSFESIGDRSNVL